MILVNITYQLLLAGSSSDTVPVQWRGSEIFHDLLTSLAVSPTHYVFVLDRPQQWHCSTSETGVPSVRCTISPPGQVSASSESIVRYGWSIPHPECSWVLQQSLLPLTRWHYEHATVAATASNRLCTVIVLQKHTQRKLRTCISRHWHSQNNLL